MVRLQYPLPLRVGFPDPLIETPCGQSISKGGDFMNPSGLQKPLLVIPASLLLLIVFILSGCGSSSSDTVSTEECALRQYTEKIYIIGEIEGELADEIGETFLNVVEYDGVSTDAPIFVAAGEMPYLSDTFRNGISDTHRNLYPVVVVDGGEEENNALLEMLGLEQNYTLPEGILYSELFAVDREEDGHVYTWSMYPPREEPLEPIDANDPPPVYTDNPTDQCRRALIFQEWIEKDGERLTPEVRAYRQEGIKALAEAMGDETGELTKLAQGFVTAKNISNAGNHYQLTYYVYSCHSFNAPNAADHDWFYVRQEGLLNASGAYRVVTGSWPTKPWDTIGYYIGGYDMENFMYGLTGQGDWVTLMAANPQNAVGVTQITSGIDWNIGGSVGFGVGTKEGVEGTGSLSGGVTIQHSSTVSVSDCEVINNSGDKVNNAKWSYLFPRRCQAWASGPLYASLEPPSLLQHTTFQPVNQWIWNFSPEVRDNLTNYSFRSTFQDTVILSRGDGCRFPWVVNPPIHSTYGGPQTFTIPLSFPPLLVVPHNVDFSAEAQYKSMDIVVARNWKAESDQDWCRVEPSSGTGDHTRVNITVDKNDTSASRTATITFSLAIGAESDTMTVFQAQY
jgi:hypothetical protein